MKFYILDENKLKFICMCKKNHIYQKVRYNYVYSVLNTIFFIYFSYKLRFFLVYNFVKLYKISKNKVTIQCQYSINSINRNCTINQ